jgi:hypothetical protein
MRCLPVKPTFLRHTWQRFAFVLLGAANSVPEVLASVVAPDRAVSMAKLADELNSTNYIEQVNKIVTLMRKEPATNH